MFEKGKERADMAYELNGKLVIGVSTRALFDLSFEDALFEREGVAAFCKYQLEHEYDILKPGPGFGLIQALLNVNHLPGFENRVEVIIMSRNSADTSLRVFHSIHEYGLNITRAVLASGASLAPYLEAFETDLFLSADENDVQKAIDSGIAAGIVCADGVHTYEESRLPDCIRIAFDGDAVLFSDASERIFQEKGLHAFEQNELVNASKPMGEGPFARFLKALSDLQREFPPECAPIRTALVTSRSAPAHERVIRTLRAWNVRIDEAFFLGGISKKDVLKAFGAQIFFDDQQTHTLQAAAVVPTARVPYRNSA